MPMPLRLMPSKQELTAVVSRACLILSCVVYATLLIINKTVYSGIISMLLYHVLFMLSAFLCVILKESRRRWNILLLTTIIVVIEISAFFVNLPVYSTSKAAVIIQNSSENVSVSLNSNYPVIDTLTPLSSTVSKGYVFNCTNSDTHEKSIVFFNPISGEYFDIE